MTGQPLEFRLPRSLGHAEIWAFGVCGLLLWLLVAGDLLADMGGYWALLVWIPITAVGVVGNLQVKRLAEHWPEMSGGTPNYTSRLLAGRPWLGRYAAMAYFQGWASVPTLSAILLSDVIVRLFQQGGIAIPALPLYVVLTGVSFAIAFSGTRSLSLLVLFFAIPAMGGLLALIVSGLAWGIPAAAAVLAAPQEQAVALPVWAKWYLICAYAAYSVETASSFFADSRDPGRARGVLSSVVWLMPVVFIGGAAVLWIALPDGPVAGEHGVFSVIRAAHELWGDAAWFVATFLVAAAALLSCATGAANSPRVLYQLALDGKAAAVFGVSSDRGVLGPALVMTVATALIFLAWQGYTAAFVVTGVGWFASFILLRLGIWLNRGESHARWPYLSLALLAMETGILVVGGWAWGPALFAAGLILPAALVGVDALVARSGLAPLRASWWTERYAKARDRATGDPAPLPGVLIALIGIVFTAAVIGWTVGVLRPGFGDASGLGILAITVVLVVFITVAFAGWTLLPRFEALRISGDALRAEVAERKRLALDLQALNDTLEQRTVDLERMNESLSAKSTQLEQSNRETVLLGQLSTMLQTCTNLEEAGQILSNFGAKTFANGPGAAYLAANSRNVLDRIAAWGEPQPALNFAPADCWALRLRRPYGGAAGEIAAVCGHTRPGATGSLCIPLSAHGEMLGVLHLEAGAADSTFAQLVGEQLSLSLADLRLRELLRDQSVRDPLTGLHNRRYLEESLDREVSRAQRTDQALAVFMLDVDHFKEYNDRFGHEGGDAALRTLARTIRGACRATDITCRFGGDEFTVAMPDTDLAAAQAWAEGLLAEVRVLKVRAADRPLAGITVSMGLAVFPGHGTDPETLVQAADLALYEAKRAGRDRLQVTSSGLEMRRRARER